MRKLGLLFLVNAWMARDGLEQPAKVFGSGEVKVRSAVSIYMRRK
jgi:hypothetical protein